MKSVLWLIPLSCVVAIYYFTVMSPYKVISASQLYQKMQGVESDNQMLVCNEVACCKPGKKITVLGITEKQEVDIPHIYGAHMVYYNHLFAVTADWEKDRTIVLYDDIHNKRLAFMAERVLRNRGFSHVYVYTGGLHDWLKNNYPVCNAKQGSFVI